MKNKEIKATFIEKISGELKERLDKRLCIICQGDNEDSLKRIKNKLHKYMESKNYRQKIGSIAELFSHLILEKHDFEQKSRFFNLEENNSPKKGFDGYYYKDEEEWLMESKAGYVKVGKNLKHKSKLDLAYKDLNAKISGKVNNNPWENAFNHAKYIEGTSEEILKHLKKLSNDFLEEKYYDIKDFNIITCATIFLNNNQQRDEENILESEIESFVENYVCKKMFALCITRDNIDDFLDYIGEYKNND